MSLKLRYFNLRGRGEHIRLVLLRFPSATQTPHSATSSSPLVPSSRMTASAWMPGSKRASRNVSCAVKYTIQQLSLAFPLPFCPVLINDKGEMMQQSLAIGAALAQKYGVLSKNRFRWFVSFCAGMLGSNPWEMGKICEIAHNYEDQIQAMVKESVLPGHFLGGDPEELVSECNSL